MLLVVTLLNSLNHEQLPKLNYNLMLFSKMEMNKKVCVTALVQMLLKRKG